MRALTTEIWLPRPVEEVFDFFGDAGNLDALTPPWMHFRVLTPSPIAMRQGTWIDYRIRWRWLPLRWRTEITLWDPPHRFIDTQIRGPYRQWIHQHDFVECDGGTFVRDRVDYAVSVPLVEPLLHRWIVRPDLEQIFAYRQQKLKERLGTMKGL